MMIPLPAGMWWLPILKGKYLHEQSFVCLCCISASVSDFCSLWKKLTWTWPTFWGNCRETPGPFLRARDLSGPRELPFPLPWDCLRYGVEIVWSLKSSFSLRWSYLSDENMIDSTVYIKAMLSILPKIFFFTVFAVVATFVQLQKWSICQ